MDSMPSSNPKEFELVRAGWVGEVWGWLIHAAFVFVMEMPVYVCSYSPWWVDECVSSSCFRPWSEHWDSRYFLYDFSLLWGLAIVTF